MRRSAEAPEEPPVDRPFLDLLAATPLGDVLFFLVVCAAAAVVVVAVFSVHPIITTVVLLAAVVVFVWRAGRAADPPMSLRDRATFGLLVAGALVAVGAVGFLLLVSACDC